jgi:hypothetical protein
VIGWVGSGRGSHGDVVPSWVLLLAVGGPVLGRLRPEPVMTVPRTAAEVLAEHVTLEVECIDRIFLNVYQPMLQHVNGVVGFFRGHRGHPFASSALMDPISKQFVASIHRFCRDQDVELVEFAKGQRKDDLAGQYRARFEGTKGCCSWAKPRRRPGCFVPRSGATRKRGARTRGS